VPLGVELLRSAPAASVVRLSFTEGRKHEVKRFCDALGHRVRRLRRIAFGPLRLGTLPVGACRPLTLPEVAALRRAAATGP
jgi:16S rRNA U516 pseudouridylate synthase RsuA-like enzyme